MADIKLEIAQKVRNLRRRAKLTQAELAEKAGLSEETIGAIERRKYSPSVETLQSIAGVFHLELHQLFVSDRKKQASEFEDKLAAIVGMVRGRDIKDLELAEQLLRLVFKRLDRD